MPLDHTGWIDQQRAAGQACGNIFADIHAEAKRRRQGRAEVLRVAGLVREARVDRMRKRAAAFDAAIDNRKGG